MAQKSVSISRSVLLGILVVSSGCEVPGFKTDTKKSPTAIASPSSESARTQANAEILQEMLRVVLLRDPQDRAYFASYVDTMNQGASIEGLYNGFTLSADYRDLEVRSPLASGAALKAFLEELNLLEKELPEPTRFGEKMALPLAKPVQPEEIPDAGEPIPGGQAKDLTFPALEAKRPSPPVSPEAAQAEAPVAAEAPEAVFARASFFNLKRVLGAEALKVFHAKKADRAALSSWYGKFAARMAGRGVDFGIPLRNKADEGFHTQWAMQASEDQLVWEVLNRLHRLLNASQNQK